MPASIIKQDQHIIYEAISFLKEEEKRPSFKVFLGSRVNLVFVVTYSVGT